MFTPNQLREYATLPEPARSLPPEVLLMHNENTLVIFDKFPKAKYHFLVLPRYPFTRQADITPGQKSLVQSNVLDDLKSLMLRTKDRDARWEIVTALANTAAEVEEVIRDEMMKTEGFEWGIDVGFHAIPSMNHIHLHVVSSDRISPHMKTKRHYNSFRPDLGFFVSIMEVKRWVDGDDLSMSTQVENLSHTAELLKAPLECNRCDDTFESMPKLKLHLEKEFEREKKKEKGHIRRHGNQSTAGPVF